jgi:hypothetical protein
MDQEKQWLMRESGDALRLDAMPPSMICAAMMSRRTAREQ